MIDRLEGGSNLLRVRSANCPYPIPFIGIRSEREGSTRTDPEEFLRKVRREPNQILFIAAASMQSKDRWVISVDLLTLIRSWVLNEVL
jgi:hypothetical protein